MSPISKALAGFAVAAIVPIPAHAQGIITQKNIPLALAQTIANAAIAQCCTLGNDRPQSGRCRIAPQAGLLSLRNVKDCCRGPKGCDFRPVAQRNEHPVRG